jgi:hypothetical protein
MASVPWARALRLASRKEGRRTAAGTARVGPVRAAGRPLRGVEAAVAGNQAGVGDGDSAAAL